MEKPKTKVKVILGTKDKFEESLAEYLDIGYKIPSGESMTVKDNLYKILLIKEKKTII